MKKYVYELRMKVRDYECDMQQVVNNAIYQHYLEHTRHEFLETLGESFGRWNEEKILPMVAKVQIEYKKSLTSGDYFICKLYIKRKGPRYVFYQDIYRESDNALCVKAEVDGILGIDGKLTRGDECEALFGPYVSNDND